MRGQRTACQGFRHPISAREHPGRCLSARLLNGEASYKTAPPAQPADSAYSGRYKAGTVPAWPDAVTYGISAGRSGLVRTSRIEPLTGAKTYPGLMRSSMVSPQCALRLDHAAAMFSSVVISALYPKACLLCAEVPSYLRCSGRPRMPNPEGRVFSDGFPVENQHELRLCGPAGGCYGVFSVFVDVRCLVCQTRRLKHPLDFC